MTEQPDTTAIRAAINAARWPTGWQILDLCDALDAARWQILDLCDALDAVRAEAALDIAYVDVLLAKISELTVRARAAEARIADLETEVSMRYRSVVHSCCEEKATAEARIAAALAYDPDFDGTCVGGHCEEVHSAMRALLAAKGVE